MKSWTWLSAKGSARGVEQDEVEEEEEDRPVRYLYLVDIFRVSLRLSLREVSAEVIVTILACVSSLSWAGKIENRKWPWI